VFDGGTATACISGVPSVQVPMWHLSLGGGVSVLSGTCVRPPLPSHIAVSQSPVTCCGAGPFGG
jgi:hypothetical protein